jgi:sec-independent protein translocase protein TatC
MTIQQASANGSSANGSSARPKAAKPTKAPHKDPEGRMPLSEHIRELRTRLFRASVSILLGAIVGWLIHKQVITLMADPICAAKTASGVAKNSGTTCANGVLTIQSATAGLAVSLKVSLLVGLLLASPIWLYQLWAFIAPGLHRNEKKYSVGFVAAAVPLFLAGAALCYVIFPEIMRVLLGFNPDVTGLAIPLDNYMGFFMRMILIFGVSFEVPLIVVALNFAGALSAQRLKHTWRYVTFAIFVFAAAAVPTGEPLGMTALAAPMCGLYYAAIGIAVLNDRRRAAKNPYANLSPDEASDLDLTPRSIEPAGPVEQSRPDYDDLT